MRRVNDHIRRSELQRCTSIGDDGYVVIEYLAVPSRVALMRLKRFAYVVAEKCSPLPRRGHTLRRILEFSEIPAAAPFNCRKQRSVIVMQHVQSRIVVARFGALVPDVFR